MPPRKRSRAPGESGGPPGKRRSKVSYSGSLFSQMMETTGMKLGGEQPNQLSTEPALFQRRLGVSLRSQHNRDKAVGDFCEGLSQYCSDHLCFKMALLPTKAAESTNISVRSCGLDSLIRILLGVDCVQPVIIDMLLEKLQQCSTGSMGAVDFKQMPTLILNQLKMLDHLVEGKEFCDKLMAVMRKASSKVQREIVIALPEIVDDPQHNDAALLLKSLLEDTPDLIAPIMDALSDFIIADHIAAEVLDVAMDHLQTAGVADLPTIIHFIMQYVNSKNAQQMISELRVKLTLDLNPLHPNIISSTPLSSHHAVSNASVEISSHFVVFDTIAATVRTSKPAADGWIKAIEAVVEPCDHRAIDILVLIFLHSIGSRKKSVETLLCNKIRGGCFSDDLLNIVLGSHAKALTEYFSSILALCDSLMCSSSPTVSSFAASLYYRLFSAFDVPYKQEVVGALVEHINNGTIAEVDHALATLLQLVHQHFTSMQKFSVLVKGVLDRLEYLTTPQIRQLYEILAVLGFTDLDRESAIQDELRILLRKQLSHSAQRYRHMGVIGEVMCIKQLSSNNNHDEIISQGVQSTTRKQLAESMLEEVLRMCEGSVESMILFCEEIVGVVSCLEPTTLAQLAEQVTLNFQDDFVIEASDPLPAGVEMLHSLDPVEDGSIALNILPLVRSDKCEGVRGCAARFHLLRVCEATLKKSLEGIDALLGCPVALCSESKLHAESLEEMPLEERQEVCLSLFHTLNWFRELVCAFSSESDPDMRGKVLLRLSNITDIQGQLERVMAVTPGWWPPTVNSWEPTGKSRSKGKRNEVSLASITTATINVDTDAVRDKNITVNIDRVKPYLRELELTVFRALGFGVLSRTFFDSEDHTRERDELKLHPPQVVLLLDDLYSKISSVFTVFGNRGKGSDGGHFHNDSLVKLMVSLVPALLDHLESIRAFFQTQLEEADGVVDMLCSHKDHPYQCLSLHLLLKSLAVFLAWPPLTDPLHCEALSTCVETLARRKQAALSGPTLPQFAVDAYQYLEGFVEVLPTLSCAHALVKLLVSLCKSCKATHIQSAIAQVCGGLLKRSWKLTEQTTLRKEALEYLLKYHLEWAGEPLVIIELISGECAVELVGDEPVEESTVYRTLTKGSFPWYYRVMMSSLVHEIKAIPVPRKNATPTPEDLNERLHTLEVSVRILFILVNLVKSFCKNTVLSACLKNARLFVDTFLKSGMPVLDSLFKARKDDVLALLKSMQQSTRLLQTYCGHSKNTGDTNLVNNVPKLKKSLEMFIFKVKELVSNHNCGDAFWMGNLKNRDIKGREILSQQPSNEEESGEEDAHSVSHNTSTSTDRTGEELMDQVED